MELWLWIPTLVDPSLKDMNCFKTEEGSCYIDSLVQRIFFKRYWLLRLSDSEVAAAAVADADTDAEAPAENLLHVSSGKIKYEFPCVNKETKWTYQRKLRTEKLISCSCTRSACSSSYRKKYEFPCRNKLELHPHKNQFWRNKLSAQIATATLNF